MAFGGILKTLLWAGIILPGALDAAELAPNSSAQIPLAVESMVYDPVSQRIYASSTNGIAVINPMLAEVETNLNFGAAGKLALTDDGQFLYFATSNNTAVAQLNLATKNLERVFEVKGDDISEMYHVIWDLKSVPGRSDSVIAAAGNGFRGSVIRLFVNGEGQPKTIFGRSDYIFGYTFKNLELGASNVLFVSVERRARDGNQVLKCRVDPDGIVETGFSSPNSLFLNTDEFKGRRCGTFAVAIACVRPALADSG